MGKTELAPDARAHQRIYDAMADLELTDNVAWYSSRSGLYWFQGLPEYVAWDALRDLVDEQMGIPLRRPPDLRGHIAYPPRIIPVYVDDNLPDKVAELRQCQPLAIIDLPERE